MPYAESGVSSESVASWSAARAREHVQTFRRVIPIGTVVSFEKGLEVFAHGSKPEEVFLLESGIVKLAYTLPDGSTQLFSLRYPGQLVEECAFVLRIPYPVSAFAVTRCQIYRIEAERMLGAMRENIELANFIVRLQDIDLYNSAVALVEMKTLRPYDRLGRLLWDLAAVIGNRRADRSTHLILPLSDKEIAQLLGFSVVHMKRSRAQLEAMRRLRREGSRGIVLFEH